MNAVLRTINVDGQPFYVGLAAAVKINEAHAGQPEIAQLDTAARSRLFWFYAGALAADAGLVQRDHTIPITPTFEGFGGKCLSCLHATVYSLDREQAEREAESHRAEHNRPDADERLAQFIAGASTRSPENSRAALPDDWPDELTDEQQHALDDLVHDAASQPASRINNDGPDAQLRYLLDQGVSYAMVRASIGL